MNRENIQKLIDKLDTLEHVPEVNAYLKGTIPDGRFNMNYYFFPLTENGCGTPACLAGWSCALSESDRNWFGVHDNTIQKHAAEWLGLDYVWAVDKLFCPLDLNIEFDELTPADAKGALERILRIGESYRNLDCHDVWWGGLKNEPA
jgi:hypothetical protein